MDQPGHAGQMRHQDHTMMSGPMHSDKTSGNKVNAKSADELKQAYGIELVSLRPTSGGQMLDLRYRVTDPALAKEVTKRNTHLEVHITDVATGQVLTIPLTHLGLLRTQSPKPSPDRLYYALFGNSGGMVKPGSEVSIKFGSVSVAGLRVEN